MWVTVWLVSIKKNQMAIFARAKCHVHFLHSSDRGAQFPFLVDKKITIQWLMAFSFHVHNFFSRFSSFFCSFYREKHDPTTQLIKIIFIFFHQYSIIFSTYTFCVCVLWVIERGKYKHVFRMQMNFALSCELREAKKKEVIEVDDKFMCDDALKGREREPVISSHTSYSFFHSDIFTLNLTHAYIAILVNKLHRQNAICL